MDYKQINTFEKALEVKGETLEQFNERTKDMDVDTVGYEKVKVIVFAINGGKHVKQGYYPWFYNPNRSSRSFSCGDYNFGRGRRVCRCPPLIDRPRSCGICRGDIPIGVQSVY